MTKQNSRTSLTALTSEYPGAVQELLKPETFTSVSWWGELNKNEQNKVLRESLELGATLMSWGEIKYKVGEHLANLQEILTPHGRFDNYLRVWQRILNRSRRSLYRDIDNWKESSALPEPVAKAAAVRNFPIDKLKTVRKMLPIPRDMDAANALAYVEKAQAYSKEHPQIHEMDTREVPVDDDLLAKESLVIFKNCLSKLPSRKKSAWAKRVMGMQLTIMGIGHALSIEPEAVPPEFVRGRGRPAMKNVIEGEVAKHA